MNDFFEDTGMYYANQGMVEKQLVLSMDSHLMYDIEDESNAKIIKKITDDFIDIAQKDILEDGPCFYGLASIQRGIVTSTLMWEY